MAKIKWSTLALDDLRVIHDYIAQDSPKYADRLMDKLIERVDDWNSILVSGGKYQNLTTKPLEN